MESTCDRLLVITRGKIVEQGTVDDLRNRAKSGLTVSVEVQGGQGVEQQLSELDGVNSVRSLPGVDERKKYTISVNTDADIRPDIFNLAKRRNWILWELHQESGRLEDLFHNLTVSAEESKPWFAEETNASPKEPAQDSTS